MGSRNRLVHPVRLVLAALALTALGAACGTSTGTTAAPSASATAVGPTDASAPRGPTGAVTGSITVSAAASLTEPFTSIGEGFRAANPDVEVTFTFDSSGTLARQILAGAPSDVFAAADEASMATLTGEDLIAGSPAVFARNQLTIVVKQGNPANITGLADLASAGTISLCGSQVPCGRYADQVLAAADVAIPADSITRGQNVKATLAAVADGDADAGIVYVTDVTGDKVEAVAIPDADNAVATYPIGVLTNSADRSTAEAFVAFVIGPQGRATLEAGGFLPPG